MLSGNFERAWHACRPKGVHAATWGRCALVVSDYARWIEKNDAVVRFNAYYRRGYGWSDKQCRQVFDTLHGIGLLARENRGQQQGRLRCLCDLSIERRADVEFMRAVLRGPDAQIFENSGGGRTPKFARILGGLIVSLSLSRKTLLESQKQKQKELASGDAKARPYPEKTVGGLTMGEKQFKTLTKGGKSSGEVQMELQAQKTRATNPTQLSALTDAWARAVRSHFNTPLVYFTAKDLAQFKRLLSLLPADQVPHRGDFLRATVANWSRFTKKAQTDYGLTAVPARPVIGFLLKYVNSAILAQELPEKTKKLHTSAKAEGPFAGLKVAKAQQVARQTRETKGEIVSDADKATKLIGYNPLTKK